ncbi:phage tail protein [Paenibacillus sp. NEAU-GSW1]|uniref:phage tail protein n=1 Tax=Paenibacillus sp. NEAU-GSW1 TaxID=2682486 RepID=UPI0012E20443|nr:tail fiber protein [Paenibacillus sp. NEAU-GSW1]MUT67221.1 phage tail protein [Paenibacillus sp. NEAU-GSW1]
MADPFVGEIRIFPFNYVPTGWAWCNGQLLPISQNTALFSLLGTNYGGNGSTNFALPDLQGKAPMFYGQGSGLTDRNIGESSGSQTVTLIHTEIPNHTHQLKFGDSSAPQSNPYDALPTAPRGRRSGMIYTEAAPDKMMHPQALSVTGGTLPHNNMQPFLTMHFAIALQGIFPPRP